MKRHLTLATVGGAGTMVDAITIHTGEARSATAAIEPKLSFADVPAWRHTLVLKGRLDYHSTPELEEEIECLCEEGVTKLTLDLRQLGAIDTIGAQVIAFRGALCQRRGHDFAVIAGSRSMQRALARAGAADVMMPAPAGTATQQPQADRRTTMIKDL
jgi:anti-anti-sigma factor